MLTLIENGDVYTPAPCGRRSVLLIDGTIDRVGDADARAIEAAGFELDVIDAGGCVVVPGFIDPHEHLLGGSGEGGFSLQSPEIWINEIVTAGITTVVGCLGVDTTMKTLPGLLAKVKMLREEGLSAYMWTGGYNIPPTTFTDSVRNDVLFVEEIIGAGEIAIADERATEPDPSELARVVHDAYVGGLLSAKAGVTHFHVGSGQRRLTCLREILDRTRFQIEPGWLYPTHVQRNEELLAEAIDLVKQGVTVDFDVAEEDLERWLPFYLEHGGEPGRLTISSDASLTRPGLLYEQFCRVVVHRRLPLELVLPMITTNAARILRLDRKGRLERGRDGDVVVLQRGSLEIVHVVAGGTVMVRDGELVEREHFLEKSNRKVALHGTKA